MRAALSDVVADFVSSEDRSTEPKDKPMTEFLSYFSLALIPAFILLDLAWQHTRYESTKRWRLKAFAVSALAFYVATRVALFWGNELQGVHVFDGAFLGTWGGAAVGIFVYEFFHYWYHRSAHRFAWLWRAGHQMHHAPERLDVFGAYYLHPVDAALFTTLKSCVFFPLLGLTPEAGALSVTVIAFNALFQHANIKTPRWLGYFVQRPESHSLHHARGVHRFNYANLPLWDIVFGTFKNPASAEQLQGFYSGASDRVGEMLMFRDVTSPRKPDVTSPNAALEDAA
jgi:sterol desaturase/sphingolipid hydroxylase (fatty acid hydroxylase superfamily)